MFNSQCSILIRKEKRRQFVPSRCNLVPGPGNLASSRKHFVPSRKHLLPGQSHVVPNRINLSSEMRHLPGGTHKLRKTGTLKPRRSASACATTGHRKLRVFLYTIPNTTPNTKA